MANEKQSGTAIQPATTAEAVVNPSDAEEWVTLYNRETGNAVKVLRSEMYEEMASNNLTDVKYNLDDCEANAIDALHNLEAPIMALREDYRRLGYVPESAEAVANAAAGAFWNAYRRLSLALGATVPTEAEVRSWSEHRAAVGSKDESYPYRRGEDGAQLEADIIVKPLEDTGAYPKLARARKHSRAVDAYEAERGAQ